MKLYLFIVPIILLLAGCEGELTPDQATKLREAIKKTSAESIPEGILDEVDPNSPTWAFLSYRIALQSYDADQFAKYTSATGVLVTDKTNPSSKERIGEDSFSFQLTSEELKNDSLLLDAIVPELIFINVKNELIADKYAKLSVGEKFNDEEGETYLILENGEWRVLNETWSLSESGMKKMFPDYDELYCFKTVLRLINIYGEPQLCTTTENDIQFSLSNDGERNISSLSVSLQGSRSNSTYALNSSIEPGLSISTKIVAYDTELVGKLHTIHIIPNIVVGEQESSCYFENSSIFVDATKLKSCSDYPYMPK